MTLQASRLKDARVVRLSRRIQGRLTNQARREWGRETCALVFGIVAGSVAKARHVVAVPNRSRSARRLAIHWADLESAVRKSRYDLIGVFHTHPHDCRPSQSDREGMAKWPVLWLIGSFNAGSRDLRLEAYHGDGKTTRRVLVESG